LESTPSKPADPQRIGVLPEDADTIRFLDPAEAGARGLSLFRRPPLLASLGRIPEIALRPDLVLLGIVLAGVLLGLDYAGGVLTGDGERGVFAPVLAFVVSAFSGGAQGAASGPSLWSVAAVFLLVAMWSLGSLALARPMAVRFGDGIRRPASDGLAFTGARAVSLIAGTLITPVLASGCTALALWLGGTGGFGSVLALPVGFLAAALCIAGVLTMPLIPAAVACDGADALDAWSRALAYLVAKPFHLVWYLIVMLAPALVVGAGLFAIVKVLLDGAGVWATALSAALGGLVLTLLAGGSTVAYLLIRQRVDGQHRHEIWWPEH